MFQSFLLSLALSLSFLSLISIQADWMLWSMQTGGITHLPKSRLSCRVLSCSPSLSVSVLRLFFKLSHVEAACVHMKPLQVIRYK